MKTTILFEPELLVIVERESPAVYKCYSQTYLSMPEYVDYGTSVMRMLMPQFNLVMFESGLLNYEMTHDELIKALQAGWVFGYSDLISQNNVNHEDPAVQDIAFIGIIKAAYSINLYSIDNIGNPDNFKERNGVIYNTITYIDAQIFIAWKLILSNHQYFNQYFVDLDAYLEDYYEKKELLNKEA